MDFLFVALFFFMIDYQDIYRFCSCQSSWRMECACLVWVEMLGGKGWSSELESLSCSGSCSVSGGTVQLDVICTCSTFQSVSIAYQFVGCP